LDELWHYLYRQEGSKLQVLMALKKLLEKQVIGQQTSAASGHIYYYLADRANIVKEYFAKFKISQKRWQKVAWVIKILKWAPFVKNISVINSLSFNNSREGSDIDILIVVKKGRLWTARAFTVLLLEITSQNKNKWYQAGKFCLGFAFDESRLNLAKIRLKKDIDFTYWLANLTPVYNKGIYQELIKRNSWIAQELPNWQPKEVNSKNGKRTLLERLLSGEMGDRLENWLAKVQQNRIWQDPKNKRQGASVVADEAMMKLHPYDQRRQRQEAWKRVLTKKFKLR